jgi:phosphocarrier protein
MKRKSVVVPWRHGLHLRPASILVNVAKPFRSTIYLRCGERVADLRNILSIIMLCATMGSGIDIEAFGDDEQDAVQAIEQVFTSTGDASNAANASPSAPPIKKGAHFRERLS